MRTIYLDDSWRNVASLVANGDYQAKLMNGEESWTLIHNNEKVNKSRNALLLKLVDAKIPHKLVNAQREAILVIGA